MSSSAIVQKLWNYCNVLRDDGMSYLPAAACRQAGGRRVAVYPKDRNLTQ